ncbi:unnamed protein product [Staurois parvus]|uniref:Uncharacterized protein n=1 Tax=Staurois parvus TaxID=386267 RepID=A0ABN9F5V5_9NEOB|nr:unnamed protein product [Staurois parvus]
MTRDCGHNAGKRLIDTPDGAAQTEPAESGENTRKGDECATCCLKMRTQNNQIHQQGICY